MGIPTVRIIIVSIVSVVFWCGSLEAAFFSMPKSFRGRFDGPKFSRFVLEPAAHFKFCTSYASECEVKRMAFRGGGILVTEDKWDQLVKVNLAVNRSIQYEYNYKGVVAEEWVINPSRGDCNDYAVSKRHELLAQGWPSRALLLAEVIVPSGEHHLILLVRTKTGSFILDNLTGNIKRWDKTPYRWVRVQTQSNPRYWASVEGHAV